LIRKTNTFSRYFGIYARGLINKTPPVPQPNEQFRRESNYSNKAHLTRGFLSAGAKQVVGALWSVNDAATSELMAKFYQKMLQGGQKPAALREA
jgi:hypothetical protein